MDEKSLEAESWLQPGASSHPNAPAGGNGPGYSVPPVLKSPPLASPDFQSPEACFFRWTEIPGAALPGDLVLRQSELTRNIEQYSAGIRNALPDQGLRSHFDLQDSRAATACQSTAGGASDALRKLRIEAHWFDYPFNQSTTLHETEVALARWRTAAGGNYASVLDDLSAAAVQLRDRTIANIKKAWLDAGRIGKQAELIETWRKRMRWIDDVSAPGGADKDSTATSSDGSGNDPKANSSAKEKSRKVWVEFQLVDSAGKPVANQKYVVKLPSGSRETGTLDVHGMVRFDGIDPGQCEVSFPDIDGREWRPM